MKWFIICFLLLGLSSCKSNESKSFREFTTVDIHHLMQDSLLNIRAIDLLKKNRGCLFLSADGRGGLVIEESRQNNKPDTTIMYDYFEQKDSNIVLNYRAVATTTKGEFGLTIGSPAYLLKAGHERLDTVYKETHKSAFYDSMDFWNDQEGIAIGDPTDDCMSVIITRDGGDTWDKLSCKDLPKSKEGEAAFAASDTNISIVGDHTWIATGGKASRIMYSPNKGKTWEIYNTPIIQGVETTGIYSIDFYDKNNGFAIGGDYTKPNDTLNNKIRTRDGGKTWQVVANGKGPSYRSCVQYIPNRKGKELVAVGFKGIDYSKDGGDTWIHLSDVGFYTIRFLNDSVAYAAGKGRLSKLTFK
ncbi:WD40/YVTN/BNR-like repeat-containing protein [Winogradskyella bathintestinalis]|uniref:Oxidoreductase n=1 Tax=Winogradskyella bathintestinalis TaxID=3035208 RepID=A0ABT7ZTE1_9FLAO|nr:oxidoreductase [Winogradskyella bathintestinalis]MDN3492238.1 oxidoreductase [Winogradskyella bathintestinalis]